jgi:uncharacterized protein YjbI with pentapeptide repeats
MSNFVELEFQATGEGAYSVRLQRWIKGNPQDLITQTHVPVFDPEYYWRYEQASQKLKDFDSPPRMNPKFVRVKKIGDREEILQELNTAAAALLYAFDRWGESPEFTDIAAAIDRLSENLRVTISTECPHLRKLPFHKWKLFLNDVVEVPDDVEVIFSGIQAERFDRIRHPDRIRILVILGDNTNISEGVENDRKEIDKYCKGEDGKDAEVIYLDRPDRDKLKAALADPKGWDIIFFSGHSDSKGGEGKIDINATDSLTMAELKDVLKPAIAKRVQIFIFNSCDGLGLAPDLEKLNIDRLIVMRELIPDEVAQKFLKNFLKAFTAGKRFDDAVKVARKELIEVEDRYPYASWLPIVIQNRLVTFLISPTWQSLGKIRSPYKGLAAFTEADADNFYGREEMVDRVAELVSQEPLVPIVGASGSGKSSLVQAGLIPKLRQDPKYKWQILTMRPGSKPFDALAQAIANCNRPNLETIALDIELTSDPTALRKTLAQSTPEHRVLLFIDQFEELFTQVADLAIRQKFLASLADAVRNAPSFTLVFTLRDDFSSKLDNNVDDDDFRPLLERYSAQKLLGMTRDRLKAAIIEPVAKLSVEFEGGLVDRLVQDVGNDAGNLPLLQMVLDLLWQHQQPRLLTHKAYDTICGEQGLKIVLANFADKIYGEYAKDKVKEFKQVLLSLVTLGEGKTPNTRRIATYGDIGEDNWQKIVVPLSTERLLKTDRDKTTNEETVEIIHETLIQSWQKLTGWVEDYRHELERIREIEKAAIEWDKNKRSKQDLWGGKKLKEARKFAKDRDRLLPLKSIVNNFLVAGGKQERWKRGQLFTLGMIVPGIFLGWAVRASLIASNVAKINNFPKHQCESGQLSPAFELLSLMKYPLKEIDLVKRDLHCINLSGVNLSGANLSGAILIGQNLSGADLSGVNLSGANLSLAILSRANLSRANLSDADLSGAKFSDANLPDFDFSGFDLNDTDFSAANLSDAILSRANLSGAILNGTNLSGAILNGTKLSGADLRGAILSDAILSGDILSGQNLGGTIEIGTKLSGANLNGTKLIIPKLNNDFFGKASELTETLAQIKLAKNWEKAKYDLKIQKMLGLTVRPPFEKKTEVNSADK